MQGDIPPISPAERARANVELRTGNAALEHAKEDLGTSEEKYRLLVDTASDAIVSIDDQGSIMFANPAIGRFLATTQQN